MQTVAKTLLDRAVRKQVTPQSPGLQAVTGAFGYIGNYITRELVATGSHVITLTGHPSRANPFGSLVDVAPFNFDKPSKLADSLQGVSTLFNTYWVRFPYGQASYEKAVENTRTLVKAAEEAGVGRIVHISVTNASEHSPLPYFRGKGLVERAIMTSRLSFAIIRPTLVFGREDILVNNIAWLLRHFPVFAVPGSGKYLVQPVFVEDLARLAVGAASRSGNVIVDGVGPDIYTFEQLVRLIAATVRSRARIVHLPPTLALALSQVIGHAIGDVLLTGDEVDGLMANLLISDGPPTGRTRLSDWLDHNRDVLGVSYASELSRHFR